VTSDSMPVGCAHLVAQSDSSLGEAPCLPCATSRFDAFCSSSVVVPIHSVQGARDRHELAVPRRRARGPRDGGPSSAHLRVRILRVVA
jgi:hypothetical protein